MTPKEESEKIDKVKLLIERLSLRAGGSVGVIAAIMLALAYNNADIYQLVIIFFVIALATWVVVGVVVSRVQREETREGLRNTHWVDTPKSE